MSGVERRRLFCAVLFHLAAALCVIWSLCVLIERSAEEVSETFNGTVHFMSVNQFHYQLLLLLRRRYLEF